MAERAPSVPVRAFLAAEGCCYAAFAVLDLAGRGGLTIPVKYGGILLCLAFAALCALRGGDRLVPAALALTACADWFLLVRNDHYAAGVALFLCVQTVYLVRLRRNRAGSACRLRSGLALGAGLAVYALDMASPLNLLAALYYSQLLSNTALAWSLGRKQRRFALGLKIGRASCRERV